MLMSGDWLRHTEDLRLSEVKKDIRPFSLSLANLSNLNKVRKDIRR